MCVAFDPEVIYNNAFYMGSNNFITKLFKKDIANFCNLLEREISQNININIKYKYVFFDFDKNAIKSFYQAYSNIFNEIGDEIFLTKKIKKKHLDEINSVYDDQVIQNALENVRRQFSSQHINNVL